ncbi:unnamed protein product [Oncorhynchus mykiss]|uniref:Reverse transcriptase zinc-binding domain-containing protein n=1 Tax=Oncorhynchus mykiss TaxID=8022 RepID=A0A060WQ86_ONCMY|nr:unnamed protein product [Oncorhynchus mykiss]
MDLLIISVGEKVWMLLHTYLLVNKIKEVSVKIIHKYYPANHYMKKFKENINSNCSFFNDHPETVLHIFWQCMHVSKLWQDISRKPHFRTLQKEIELYFKMVKCSTDKKKAV